MFYSIRSHKASLQILMDICRKEDSYNTGCGICFAYNRHLMTNTAIPIAHIFECLQLHLKFPVEQMYCDANNFTYDDHYLCDLFRGQENKWRDQPIAEYRWKLVARMIDFLNNELRLIEQPWTNPAGYDCDKLDTETRAKCLTC